MFTTQAQEVKIQSKPFTFPTEQKAIGNAHKTSKFVMLKKQQYELYQSNRGSWYYITKNANGEYKRNYVKVEPVIN